MAASVAKRDFLAAFLPLFLKADLGLLVHRSSSLGDWCALSRVTPSASFGNHLLHAIEDLGGSSDGYSVQNEAGKRLVEAQPRACEPEAGVCGGESEDREWK